MLTLNTDESQPNIVVHLTHFLLNNTVIIDKAKHWSANSKESFAIRRQNPELNHGTKTSIELSIFNWRHIYLNTVIIIYLAANM